MITVVQLYSSYLYSAGRVYSGKTVILLNHTSLLLFSLSHYRCGIINYAFSKINIGLIVSIRHVVRVDSAKPCTRHCNNNNNNTIIGYNVLVDFHKTFRPTIIRPTSAPEDSVFRFSFIVIVFVNKQLNETKNEFAANAV